MYYISLFVRTFLRIYKNCIVILIKYNNNYPFQRKSLGKEAQTYEQFRFDLAFDIIIIICKR